MKVKELKNEFKRMSKVELETKIDEFRRELLILRLQAATQPVKSFSSQKQGLKKLIACGLTLLSSAENN